MFINFLCRILVKNQPVPLVPWNSEQHAVLAYQPFLLLLHKLGFQLTDDSNGLWVRIPNTWTAETLFNVADKLGPIDECRSSLITINEAKILT